ncbi:MAG: DUF4846 domain-containing protein [Deltaproteobacteria bacterium]|nr:DUF4846 domain-containing protein [Deltaproteobacteria bacterium]
MGRFIRHVVWMVASFVFLCCVSVVFAAGPSKVSEIPVPDGFELVAHDKGSFGEFLSSLPLKKNGTPVYLHNGKKKRNQDAHYAVVDLKIGKNDLEQCADAVMRLRADYLYSSGRKNDIAFRYTSGHLVKYSDWAKGIRPVVSGNKVTFTKSASPASDEGNYRAYLDSIYTYAGSFSLSKELKPVTDINDIRAGDVFIQGGFPGHAVIVVAIAVNKKNGKKLFMLAQSYMPAQEIHVLKNNEDARLSPWYDTAFGETLYTPEWTFKKGDLKRF